MHTPLMQVELLIATVVGLGSGHATLNLAEPIAESVEPCCVEPLQTADQALT